MVVDLCANRVGCHFLLKGSFGAERWRGSSAVQRRGRSKPSEERGTSETSPKTVRGAGGTDSTGKKGGQVVVDGDDCSGGKTFERRKPKVSVVGVLSDLPPWEYRGRGDLDSYPSSCNQGSRGPL